MREEDEIFASGDPRSKVWCSEHVCWRTRCHAVHEDFIKKLARAREAFKDVG